MNKRIFSFIFGIHVYVVLLLTTAHIASPATLNDYWNGEADWKFVRKWTMEDLDMGNGVELGDANIVVIGNTWYLFSRSGVFGSQVRRSTDGGRIWGSPVDIIVPTAGTPWAFQAVEGDAFYDPDTQRWHYFFGCNVAKGAIGNGCYATKKGSDPRGGWDFPKKDATDPTKDVPVIEGNALWKKICKDSTDDCHNAGITDGATFEIFKKDEYLWVSFHGYSKSRYGWRGLVKIKAEEEHLIDLDKWIVNDTNEVPGDAIVDRKDIEFATPRWREDWGSIGPIGAGHGSILEEGGYYYLLVETPNNDLGGEMPPGQKWDAGLFRTDDLTSTEWEQLNDKSGEYQNPILYSTWPPLTFSNGDQVLTLQYPRLFKAGGRTYMTVVRNHCNYTIDNQNNIGICNGNDANRDVSGLYLYTLEDSSDNKLKNGDLWIAAEGDEYWHQTKPADMKIYRHFWKSSDGNQWLDFNCGAASTNCAGLGASIYQDVNVRGYQGRTFTFSGKFAAHKVGGGGGNGTLKMVVHQFASDGSQSADSITVSINAGSISGDPDQDPLNQGYRASEVGSGVVASDTVRLRYELYPETAGFNFRADEMYLNIGNSTDPAQKIAPPENPPPASTLQWDMFASSVGHVIGRSDSDAWSANTAQDAPGFLQFGPYTTALGAGQHTAFWKLLIDNNSAGNDSIVQIQVYDYDDNQVLAWRNIKRNEWANTFTYQEFRLPFFLSEARAGHRLEFRVWWYDRAYVREDLVGVDRNSGTPDPGPDPTLSCSDMTPDQWDMFAFDIGHVIGRKDDEGWSANTLHDQEGYLQFGPYIKTLGTGEYMASWSLMIDNNSAGSDTVARIEVADFDAGQQIIASRDIRRNEWSTPFTYQTFDLEFSLDASRIDHRFEFRVWWYDRAYIREQSVSVRCSSIPPPPTPTPPPNPTPTPTPPPNPTPTPTPMPSSWEWDMFHYLIGHLIGRKDGEGWSANTVDDSSGWLQFGPYISTLGAGWHTVTWTFMIDNNSADNLGIVYVEVVDYDDGFHVLASDIIKRNEWNSTFTYQDFDLPFYLDAGRVGHRLEFRVLWYGIAYVRERKVRVR